MPRHVIMTADITVERSRIHVEVTDAEERDGPVPTCHTEIPGCRAEVLAAIGRRKDGSYKGVRFRPGVGSADFIEATTTVLWCKWNRMANFFTANYGDPREYGRAFIGPVRTGGAGDTQWRIDTAAGTASSPNLIAEAVREFVELGFAEPALDHQGRTFAIEGYGTPILAGDLAKYQGTINETIAEEWGAYDASLRPTFSYEIVPIDLPIGDTLVGSPCRLIVTANTSKASVGAVEFILPVERRFEGRAVAVVDIEATRDREGMINGFVGREVKLIAGRSGQMPMIFNLSPYGGISEHGLNVPLNHSTAPYVLNTKSRAACRAAGIWPIK